MGDSDDDGEIAIFKDPFPINNEDDTVYLFLPFIQSNNCRKIKYLEQISHNYQLVI